MARWKQAQGPPAIFFPTLTSTPLPGMTITDTFGGGPCLIFWTIENEIVAGGPFFLFSWLRYDGVEQDDPAQSQLVTGQAAIDQFHGVLRRLPAGPHTIDLMCNGDGNPNQKVPANACFLHVIELPIWDDITKLIETFLNA